MTLESTAYHEAGHVVVAYHCKAHLPEMERVWISPTDCSGAVRWREDVELKSLSEERLYAHAQVLAAGALAEILLQGDTAGHEADMADFSRVAHWYAAQRLSRQRGARSRRLRRAEIERGIRRAYDAVLPMMARAFAAAELTLRAHWGAVETVADWLLTSGGVLPGEHVGFVLESAPHGQRLPSCERLLELVTAAEGDRRIEAAMRHASSSS